MNTLEENIEKLLEEQIRSWKLAKDNYAALSKVQTRVVEVDGWPRVLQFNPERIRSSAANIDKASLQARPCFFCNRPDEQQGVTYNNEFDVLVNPYPIFEHHLTLPFHLHEKQLIKCHFEAMLLLTADMPDYFVFYNGPKSGASAPDHMHFQAGRKGSMPFMEHYRYASKSALRLAEHTTLYLLQDYLPSAFLLASGDLNEAVGAFNYLYDRMERKEDENEPMMNVLMWKDEDIWLTAIFPRKELRPSCFYAEGDRNILISPATVEMAGLFVVPLEKDFRKVTATDLETILKEVSLEKEKMEQIFRTMTSYRHESTY